MAEKAEIGAAFTITDAATATLDKIKSGFKSVSDASDKVFSSMVDIGKTAIGAAIGINMGSAIQAMNSLGAASIQRAIDFQNVEKNALLLSASLAKAGMSFDQLKANAQGFVKDMKSIEIQTGITSATLGESFAAIADKFNPARAMITQTGTSILMPLDWIEQGLQRSDAQIKQIFNDIGQAGKLVPGGADALAKSFANFSGTGAKASDPIVQMIAMTGTLKGNARQVAMQLNQLTDASALSFAQAAIEKMAKKAKDIPPDFNTVVNQLSSLKDQFLTNFGQPILQKIVPVMERFKNIIETNRAAFDHFAKVMGEKVGKYVTDAAKSLENGFKYVVNHADEIAKAIEKGAETAKQVFDFILAHKEEIAVAYGVKAVAPGVLSAGKGALDTATMVAARGIGPATGIAGAGMALGAATLTAFVVALGAATAAIYNFKKLIDENYYKGSFGEKARKEQTIEAMKEEMIRVAQGGEGDPEQVKQLHERYIQLEKEMGRSEDSAKSYIAALNEQKEAQERLKKSADFAKGFLEGGSGTKLRTGSDVPTQIDSLSDKQAEGLVSTYNLAIAQNNKQTALYVANIIASSSSVQNALVNSKAQLSGGFDGLAEVLGEKGLEVTSKLKKLVEEASGTSKGATPTKPVVQFNNNTFNLNQNFRDNDPDKIAVIFRQDILKQAENRRQSRVGGAFGL